ncbi:MAG: mechanosensitive ion channel [Chloroflexi bacterium]|nr:mechanosensitive ion channel [Chloroflexota bacterium]
MDDFLTILTDFFNGLMAQTARQAPVILLALLAFIAGLYFARLAKALVQRGLRFRRADPELSLLLGRIVQWGIIIFALLFATQQIGVDVTAFLTGLGILGFTLGFALQDISKNFVSGILMLLQKPFSLGDTIEVSGFNGKVLDITLRDTVLLTGEGLRVRIPNGDIFTKPIVNFSRLRRRRIEITLGVDYDSDLDEVRQVALETIKNIPGVLSDPAVDIVFESFAEHAIRSQISYWYDESKTSHPRALDAGISGLKSAFDRAGIEVPVPYRELRLHEDGARLNDRVRAPQPNPPTHPAGNGSAR